MVTPVPQHQPFNVGAQIGRVGSAIQSASNVPLQGVQTMQALKSANLSDTRQQQEIDKEVKRIADLEERGRRFDEYKKETAVRILGSDEAFNSLFSSADTAKGRLPVDVQGPQPKPTPGTEGLAQSQRDLARKVMEAETKTELGMVMTNASKLINAYESAVQGTGKSVAYAEPNFQELRAYKTGKDKYEMPYADNYMSHLESQKDTFLKEGVRNIIDEKLKKAKTDPATGKPDISQQEVLQAVFKDPEFNEMAYDKDFVTGVKAAFQDGLATYRAQSERLAAGQKKEAAATTQQSKGVTFSAQQEEIFNDNIKSAANSGLKAENMAKRAAWAQVREQLPINHTMAQKKFNDLWKEQGDEFEAQASLQILNQQAQGDYSEDSYDMIIDENGGPLPGIKNYSEWLRLSNQKRPPQQEKTGIGARIKEAIGLGGKEPEAATPATFTPEQEKKIVAYEEMYKGTKTREQIIAAMKKGGHL